MIRVTRLDGTPLMLNAEWIQSVESTPDTLITLTTGFKLLVKDPVATVIEAFHAYKHRQTKPPVFWDLEESITTAKVEHLKGDLRPPPTPDPEEKP